MQGRVFQRSPGRGKPWSFAVDLPRGADGRRRQRLKGGFRTKVEAEKALAALIVEADRGMVVDPTRITVAEYLRDWLADTAPSIRRTTADLYRATVENWIVPHIGGLPLQAVTPQHLQALYRLLLESGRADGTGGLSPRSVRLAHQVLHSSFERAVDWRVLPRNPAAARLDLPQMKRAALVTWTPEQARAFLTATSRDRLHPLWTVMLSTGLRRGEVLGLRWEDVDLDAARLSVRQSVVVSKGVVLLAEPKTAAGRRSVVLYSQTVEALRRHRRAQAAERLLIGPGWAESNLVFTTTVGTVIHPRNLARDFHLACARAGVPSVRLHDLRHTAATLALTAGAHPKQVQEMLGHARVAITLDVYSHVTPQMHEETAEKIGRQLFG